MYQEIQRENLNSLSHLLWLDFFQATPQFTPFLGLFNVYAYLF